MNILKFLRTGRLLKVQRKLAGLSAQQGYLQSCWEIGSDHKVKAGWCVNAELDTAYKIASLKQEEIQLQELLK